MSHWTKKSSPIGNASLKRLKELRNLGRFHQVELSRSVDYSSHTYVSFMLQGYFQEPKSSSFQLQNRDHAILGPAVVAMSARGTAAKIRGPTFLLQLSYTHVGTFHYCSFLFQASERPPQPAGLPKRKPLHRCRDGETRGVGGSRRGQRGPSMILQKLKKKNLFLLMILHYFSAPNFYKASNGTAHCLESPPYF